MSRLVALAAGFACVMSVVSGPAAADERSAAPGNAWTEISHPRPSRDSYLFDVVAPAAGDVWAVGYRFAEVGGTFEFRTYGQHCTTSAAGGVHDEPTCTQANLPNIEAPPLTSNQLAGIDAASPTDLWAVGWARATTGLDVALVTRYDGTNWQLVDAPEPAGATGTYLHAVAAPTAGSALAVGSYQADFDSHPVAMEWTGLAWRLVPVPVLPGCAGASTLNDVADAGNVFYVVGSCRTAGGQDTGFVLTYSRGQWSTQVPPLDPVLPSPSVLEGVAVVPGGGVWAVGTSANNSLQTSTGITLRRGGAGWSALPVPQVGSQTQLAAVAGVARDQVWSVGLTATTAFAERLSLYWNGRRYVRVPAGNTSKLYAVTYDPDGYWWSVGHDLGQSVLQRIAAR